MNPSLFEEGAAGDMAREPGAPPATWLCPQCAFTNPADKPRCLRCGTPRPQMPQPAPPAPGDATVVAAASRPDKDVTVTGIPLSAPPGRRQPLQAGTVKPERPARAGSKTTLILLVIILLALGGLGYIGYVAWSYGYLDDYLPKAWRVSSKPGAATTAGQSAEAGLVGAASAPESDHPLLELSESKESQLRVLKHYINPLVAIESMLDRFSVKSTTPGVLDPDTLAQLTALQIEGLALLDEYVKFEAQAKELTSDKQQPFVELVRAQFAADLLRLIQQVGLAFSLDLDGEHPAYDLHVKAPWTLKEYGLIDPQPYDDAWIAAIKERQQTELDIRHQDIYRSLRVRQEALAELHEVFGRTMNEMPQYTSRGGVLNHNGHELLRLLDSYLDKLEDLYLEYEEFRGGLKLEEEPQRFTDYCEDYLFSIKQDHLFCFTEIYKIYTHDEELTDPIYTKNLDVHYAFVKEHWGSLEVEYRQIAAQYEDEWARLFRGHGTMDQRAAEPEAEPPPAESPDEIPWMR